MSVFATEFPVKNSIAKAQFAGAVIAWIRGINKSKILDQANTQEFYDDDIWLESDNGETLSIKGFEDGHVLSFGARLEIPDDTGRRWRTECVYSRFGQAAFLRVRGQCVATSATATVLTPKKPVFITQSIDANWSEKDGSVQTSSTPHHLNDSDLQIASSIFKGSHSTFLPIIYLSRNNDNSLPTDPNRLAKAAAGVAHVFIEPTRGFSFKLREALDDRNPYGGAIGIVSPTGNQIARIFPYFDNFNSYDIADRCVEYVNEYMSGFATSKGWEWQQLQEAQTRKLREVARLKDTQNSKELNDYIELVDAEIEAKDEQIDILKDQLEIARVQAQAKPVETDHLIPTELARTIGSELYEGEFSDRLRRILAHYTEHHSEELDTRTNEFAKRFIKKSSYSGRAISLVQQIKGASRDGNQMPKLLGGLLQGFGFSKSQDGKHLKFTPPSELFGIQPEILPSTPSDSQRGGRNRGAEIIRAWGLNELNRR
ncbi:hypothetical protein K3X44_01270 [Aliiroseovarius crassostreae]|uniref:hypothetical protein n=1 Tax=Aliiroseovarius crassostreae TaxID=154981 RepID=UPI0021FC66F8|nr:hypothetical protein [Aliiroseovarius crassostreae]UWQ02015.1 hypothetical protein K3X44_01270 [Aliiroseovarius crassostreae]